MTAKSSIQNGIRATLILWLEIATFSLIFQGCSSNKDTSSKNIQPTASAAQVTVAGQENWKLGNIFLPTVNKHLEKLGVETLKDVKMIEESKEIRFWIGFSHHGFTGLILKGRENEWSATYIPASNLTTSSLTPRQLPPPRNGWDNLLSEIEALGVYKLPGEPDPLPERLGIKDGIAAIVEIKTPALYKAYLYMGLNYYDEPNVKKVEKIINLLSEEFEVGLY